LAENRVDSTTFRIDLLIQSSLASNSL